jgi:hypothetical protein
VAGRLFSMGTVLESSPALLLARIANGGDRRVWLVLGAVLGLGLLNKLSVLWLGLGLGFGLVATRERRWLVTPIAHSGRSGPSCGSSSRAAGSRTALEDAAALPGR